jgi:hypothetical protein
VQEQIDPSYAQLLIVEHACPSGTAARVGAQSAGFIDCEGSFVGQAGAPVKYTGEAHCPDEQTVTVLHCGSKSSPYSQSSSSWEHELPCAGTAEGQAAARGPTPPSVPEEIPEPDPQPQAIERTSTHAIFTRTRLRKRRAIANDCASRSYEGQLGSRSRKSARSGAAIMIVHDMPVANVSRRQGSVHPYVRAFAAFAMLVPSLL